MRNAARCTICFFLFFSLLPPLVPTSAFDMFEINADGGKTFQFSRKASNVRRWPRNILDAIEAIQADLLFTVQFRSNWQLVREVVGSNEYYQDITRWKDWEKKHEEPEETRGEFFSWPFLESSVPGPKLDASHVNAFDTIYGPEDCNKSDAVNTSLVTSTRTFVDGGRLYPYATQRLMLENQPPTPDTKGAYAARFRLATWDCPKEKDVDETFSAPTKIPWLSIMKKNMGSLGALFTGAHRNKRRALYVRKDLTGPEPAPPGTCMLSDASGDSTDLATKNKGSQPAADLKSATVVANDQELTATIETYGNLPETFAKDDSLAFEIGFDRGGGSRNPLSPRDGIDLLFVVDVGRSISGLKQTPGSQSDWTPKAVQKLPQGIRVSISRQDIQDAIPPMRIFLSAVLGKSLDFDTMENHGVRSCTFL